LEARLDEARVPFLVRHLAAWIPARSDATIAYPLFYLRGLRPRLWSLLHIIEREHIDLIYTNTSLLLEGALAARRARLPHVWHIHEYVRGNADLRPYVPAACIDKITQALSDKIITVSSALARSRFRGIESKTRVVYNGLDLDVLRGGDSTRIRSLLPIAKQHPIVIFIGAISQRKDPLTFIRAAAIVHAVRPDVHFLVVGAVTDPILERRAVALISTSNLGARCHLLGLRDDVKDLLAAAAVYVSTSIQETFGLATVEAMATGTPVVVTRCGGPEEVVSSGDTGVLVSPRDHDAVASAILDLLAHPETARRMGEAGKLTVEQFFTVQSYARHISEVLEEALGCATVRIRSRGTL
jgi:glycosyltransferase involved in cell wall biosynthesis